MRFRLRKNLRVSKSLATGRCAISTPHGMSAGQSIQPDSFVVLLMPCFSTHQAWWSLLALDGQDSRSATEPVNIQCSAGTCMEGPTSGSGSSM